MRAAFYSLLLSAALLSGAPLGAAPPADTATAAAIADDMIVVIGPRADVEPFALPAAIAQGRIEGRRYVKRADVRAVLRAALRSRGARIAEDDSFVSGREIGRPCEVVRRVRVENGNRSTMFLISDSEPRWPFGGERASVGVRNVAAALGALERDGATVVVPPFTAGNRETAIVRTAEGVILEIHGPRRPVASGLKLAGARRAYRSVNTDRPALTGSSTIGSLIDPACVDPARDPH